LEQVRAYQHNARYMTGLGS